VIEDFQGISPVLGKDVFVAPSASVVGAVRLGDCSSVWHGASVRGDVWKISVGDYSNIQDACVCHVTTGGPELVLGKNVTVGHGAVLHSCTIGDNCLIGMGAVILDGVRIGRGSIIAANSVLLEGTDVPPGSMVAGVPGVMKKELGKSVEKALIERAVEYHKLALAYIGKRDFNPGGE